MSRLGDDYADAWAEWAAGDGRVWKATVGDGPEPDDPATHSTSTVPPARQ